MRINNKLRKLHRLQREVLGLLVVVVVLALLLFCSWAKDDRKAPQIIFGDVISNYVLGDGDGALLKGVKAIDDKDGDITDRIIIYQTKMVSQNEISITYQVRDSHGNLSQMTRTCQISVLPGGDTPDPTVYPTLEDPTETTTEAVIDITSPSTEGGDETEPVTTEETEPSGQETTTQAEPSTEQPTEKPTEKPTKKPEETTTPVLTSLEIQFTGGVKYAGDITYATEFVVAAVYSDGSKVENLNGWGSNEVGKALVEGDNTIYFFYETVISEYVVKAEKRPENVVQPTQPANNGIPVLTLSTNEVHVKKGDYFHYRKVIAELYDDKDSESVLRERIRVEGWDKFSTNKKGVYVLKISVLDTDKNRSAISTLTVYVE